MTFSKKFLMFFIAATGLCWPYRLWAEKMDKIIAIVNEDVITEDELNLFMRMLGSEEGDFAQIDPVAFKKMLLNRMIEDRLILQEAKRLELKPDEKIIEDRIKDIKQKAGSDRAFEEALKSEGISLNEIREKLKNQLLIYLVIEKEVKAKANVSPKEVTDYFQQHRDEFMTPETLVVDSIFVKDKETIEKVAGELAEGKEFKDVSETYSQKSSIGDVRRGQLKKDLEDFIFGLNIGQSSEPFQVEDGFYIFLVKERHALASETLDGVKDKVIAQLEKAKMEKILKEWLLTLKEKAYISIRG